MRIRKLPLVLCLAVGAVAATTGITSSPASATHQWHQSTCNNRVEWADDHAGGYNYWATHMSPYFNGYNIWGAALSIYGAYTWECGPLGHPLSNLKYDSNVYAYYWQYQNFNCGVLHFRNANEYYVQWFSGGCIY